MKQKIYEISLWEEKLIQAQPYTEEALRQYLAATEDTGAEILTTDKNTNSLTVFGETIPAYYKESKIAVIGSNSMTSNCRAIEPQLVSNINGTNTFTFKMYYTYTDNATGEIYQNPFLKLLVNERRVKVYWPQPGNEQDWYDLVIKKCEEDSSGKSITYTCNDLFINELAKTGYNIEFDNKLENNQGTAIELGARTVDTTDWKVINTDGYILTTNENNDVIPTEEYISDLKSEDILQTTQEPVYERVLSHTLNATNQATGSNINIASNKKILIFYSQYPTQVGTTSLQFLYAETYQKDFNSLMVNNADCYEAIGEWVEENNIYIFKQGANKIFEMPSSDAISSQYRGRRLVNSQVSVYDTLTNRYCNVYDGKVGTEYEGHVIYEYVGTDYSDVTTITNLLTNGTNFSNVNGWTGQDLLWKLYPIFDSNTDLAQYKAYGYFNPGKGIVYNNGLQSYSSFLSEGIQCGDKLIFRYKAYDDNNGLPNLEKQIKNLIPRICTYEESTNLIIPATKDCIDYVTVGETTLVNGWYQCELDIIISATRSELYNKKIGFFIDTRNPQQEDNSNATGTWIKEIELFKKVVKNNEIVYPNSTITGDVASIYYYYYDKTANSEVTSIDDLNYISKSTVKGIPESLASKISARQNGFKKIRAITTSGSNRFNILQDIAEQFECWVRFHIIHTDDGHIKYVNGKPQKYITFVNNVGVERGVVFRYGTDLKSIRRTIESEEIVTKTIVNKNSNEYAENGFCTIARSNENPTRDSFILNFDYYLENGLLDGDSLNKDLYSATLGYTLVGVTPGSVVPQTPTYYYIDQTTHKYVAVEIGSQFQSNINYFIYKTDYNEAECIDNYIGYYYWLQKYNKRYDELTEQIVELSNIETQQEASLKINDGYLSALAETISNLEEQIRSMAAAENITLSSDYVSTNLKDNINLQKLIYSWQNSKQQYHSYLISTDTLKQSVENIKNTVQSYKEEHKKITQKLKKLHYDFFSKYGHYIQEGIWTSEDYVDDTLYYLDALDIAYTSSRPKVSYTIDVLRLNRLEEYSSKIFGIGDICYLEDTEFFGYLNDQKTPYHEKFLISEISCSFDDPSQDRITVQNYKTQFEDLFQRITATTQSLSYKAGEYARAANIVTPTGTIEEDVLQNSLSYNQNLVLQAQNESVYWDATGLTVTDTTDASKRTKVTSGGIFISTDGGATWKNAIRGEGISTQYLTAGSINVNSINLYDGAHKTFRWDDTGINAYYQNINGINTSKFVRFDQYGIYGVNGNESFIPNSEDDIWRKAQYALTWKGFMLKSAGRNGYVSITSDDDIQVITNDTERIKIGLLDAATDLYGIRISDAAGRNVIYTGSDGNLYLSNTLTVQDETNITRIGHFESDEEYQVTDNLSREDFLNWKKVTLESIDPTLTYYIATIVKSTANRADPRVLYWSDINGKNPVYPTSVIDNPTELNWYETQFKIWSPYVLIDEDETVGAINYYIYTNLVQSLESDIYVKDREYWTYLNKVTDSKIFTQVSIDETTFNKDKTNYWYVSSGIYDYQKIPSEKIILDNGYITKGFYYKIEIAEDLNYYIRNEEDYYINVGTVEELNYILANGAVSFEDTITPSPFMYYSNNQSYYTRKYTTQIINSNNNFIVYADGSVYANNGTFIGEIRASSGSFDGYVTAETLKAKDGVFYYLDSNNREVNYATLSQGLYLYGNSTLAISKYDASQNVDEYYPVLNVTQEEFDTNKTSFYVRTNCIILNQQTAQSIYNPDILYYHVVSITESTFNADKTKFYIQYSENNTLFIQQQEYDVYSSDVQYFTYTKITQSEFDIDKTQFYTKDSQIFVFVHQNIHSVYNANTQYYYYNPINLYLDDNGNIIFKGILNGASGNFSGEIFATGGTIGGFNINNKQLSSTENVNNPNIVLDGITGTITTKQLLIEGGTITGELKIGTAKLKAPINSKDTIFENGGITINNDTTMNIGEILLDGTNSLIKGTNFSITPNLSTFSNVNITGKLSTVVFEKDHVQMMGGAMLFCTEYEVIDSNVSGDSIVLTFNMEDSLNWGLTSNSLIVLISDNGKYHQSLINAVNTNTITIPYYSFGNAENIRYIGVLSQDRTESSLLIGINSTDGNTGLIQKRGISFNSISYEKNANSSEFEIKTTIRTFLGDLSAIGYSNKDQNGNNVDTYGLYSDNVYLKGSLITEVIPKLGYAGVNTTNGVQFTQIANDTSPIVFWAGANTESDVVNAKFQVTQQGTLYASQAKIVNSIFVGADIIAANIYAAEIHGWNNQNNQVGELKIFDTSNGIGFYSETSPNERLFNISTEGLYINDRAFVNFEQLDTIKVANFIGRFYSTIPTNNAYYLSIIDNRISYNYKSVDSNSINSYLELNNNSLIFSINNGLTQSLVNTSIDTRNITNEELNQKIEKRYVFNNDNVCIGYDTYIS